MSTFDKTYDVALSFAGEDREYVREVATALTSLNVSVFYDQFEEAELWGKDLYEHFSNVFRHQAKFSVMFISEHYARKIWTTHERRSAQDRALRENREYILPVRFDSTELPGLLSTIGYVRAEDKSPEELASLVVKKVEALASEFQRAMCEVKALLKENRRIYRSFGPNSSADVREELRTDLTLWESAKSETIMPNNDEIASIIGKFQSSVPSKFEPVFQEMLNHIYAFKEHCNNPDFDYSAYQFPASFPIAVEELCHEVD